MNWKIPSDATAGTDNGSTSLMNVVTCPAPSMRADSISSLGSADTKFLRMKMQIGRPKATWAIQTPTYVPTRSRSGKIVTVPMWAPPLNSWSNGINDIWSGTISSATTPTNNQSRPLKFIHENAYAASSAIPTESSTAGTVITSEFMKNLAMLSSPGADDSTLR